MIYEKIKQLCNEKHISIYRVEKDLGFSSCSVVKWKVSMPTVDKLQKLASYFEVPMEYFLANEKKEDT